MFILSIHNQLTCQCNLAAFTPSDDENTPIELKTQDKQILNIRRAHFKLKCAHIPKHRIHMQNKNTQILNIRNVHVKFKYTNITMHDTIA